MKFPRIISRKREPTKTYVIGLHLHNGQYIHCLVCGMKSYHPKDIEHKFCGNCHQFHDVMGEVGEGDAVLSSGERYFRRASGKVLCEECGEPYSKHPMESAYTDQDGHPYLNRLCDDTLVKL